MRAGPAPVFEIRLTQSCGAGNCGAPRGSAGPLEGPCGASFRRGKRRRRAPFPRPHSTTTPGVQCCRPARRQRPRGSCRPGRRGWARGGEAARSSFSDRPGPARRPARRRRGEAGARRGAAARHGHGGERERASVAPPGGARSPPRMLSGAGGGGCAGTRSTRRAGLGGREGGRGAGGARARM